MQKVIVHTDGGARGNPGPAAVGVVIADEKGKVQREVSEYIGETTNNIAEYEALIRALEELQKLFGARLGELSIEVRMDSELVVRQLSGRYKVKEPALKERFVRVSKLLAHVSQATFSHVRREENKEADRLVNKALDARA